MIYRPCILLIQLHHSQNKRMNPPYLVSNKNYIDDVLIMASYYLSKYYITRTHDNGKVYLIAYKENEFKELLKYVSTRS